MNSNRRCYLFALLHTKPKLHLLFATPPQIVPAPPQIGGAILFYRCRCSKDDIKTNGCGYPCVKYVLGINFG